MSSLRISSDEKSGRNLLSAFLGLAGLAISALGLFGLYAAVTDAYYTDPGLFPAALLVTMIGAATLWIAISLYRETRRATICG